MIPTYHDSRDTASAGAKTAPNAAANAAGDESDQIGAPPRPQFSLRAMFLFTTGLAVLFALLGALGLSIPSVLVGFGAAIASAAVTALAVSVFNPYRRGMVRRHAPQWNCPYCHSTVNLLWDKRCPGCGARIGQLEQRPYRNDGPADGCPFAR